MTGAWRIAWDRGTASVQSLGGMLGPADFVLADGRRVQPFAVGGWADDGSGEQAALPGLLRRLRGEWPCVPFGIAGQQGLPDGWRPAAVAAVDAWPHGYGSNHDWSLVSAGADSIVLRIEYPPDHPVRALQREIRGVPGRAELHIGLAIEARSAAELTLALHPILRLPAAPRQAEVAIAGAGSGRTLPFATDATSLARPDQPFASLEAVPAAAGGFLDFSRLPFESANEELLQIAASGGTVALRNLAERYVATLEYDAGLFPTVMLWIANCGRTAYPWNGAFRALGIEPARGAFDLGPAVSANPDNPWRQAGVPTTLHMAAGETISTTYRIGVAAL